MPVFEATLKRTLVLETSVLVEANTEQGAGEEINILNKEGYLGLIKSETLGSRFTWKHRELTDAVESITDITDRVEDV